jgi:NDP-hexose 2,3-enoyl reductase
MNYRRLGRSGLKVSELCLGAWINFGGRIEDEETFAILDTAVEEGIDFSIRPMCMPEAKPKK